VADRPRVRGPTGVPLSNSASVKRPSSIVHETNHCVDRVRASASIRWSGPPRFRSFQWGFAFDVDQPRVRWYVSRWVGNDELTQYLSLAPYFKSGVVDRDLMLKQLRHYVRKWVA